MTLVLVAVTMTVTLSTAGIVHHSVVAISRISLPTTYYGVLCANSFSAVFFSWERARPFIEGHTVVHGKFKMEHQAAVLAFHGINLRTSPTAPYPPYVPEIVLDAAPADYRPRFPDLQVQVVPAPGVPIPATVLASDQPSGAHVPCQCDLRRLLTDPVRADVLATADNTRCECGVMGFSA